MIKLDKNDLIVLSGDELLTSFEKKRKHQTEEIKRQYEHLSRTYPDASPNLFFGPIAEKVKMTKMGVRNIAIKEGLYTPKRELENLLILGRAK